MNTRLPKITVVTAVFNGARFIEATFQSVFSQNYPDLEYIVIDGGSTDGTQKIIDKYKGKISFYISEKDNGLYDALNKGFARATGDIMCYINADDLHHPDSLQCAAAIFSQFPQVEWITGTPSCFDEQGICREIVPQRKWSKYQYLSGDYFTIQQESVFWRKSLWERTGARFDDQLKLAGDFELWMRFFRADAKLYSARALLGGFRRHGSAQLSHAIEKYRAEIKNYYSKIKFTESEKKALEKIRKHQKTNKVPFVRGKLKIQEKLDKIYDFPPEIRFDFSSQKYFLK